MSDQTEFEKELAASVARAEDLRAMLVTPGWKHFDEMLKQQIAIGMNVMMNSKDPYDVMGARQVVKVLQQLGSWPVREVQATETALVGEQSTT